MQAVVKFGTSQYLVEPGQELLINHLTGSEKTLVNSEVMLLIDGSDVQVGTPFLEGVRVKATVLNEEKGQKLRVAKFKAKSRYRKVVGFRPIFSRIKIDSIDTSKEPEVVSQAKSVKKEKVTKVTKVTKAKKAKT